MSRVGNKRARGLAGVAMGLGLGTAATALAVFEVPGGDFEAGRVLRADDLNTRFQALAAELNRLDGALAQRDLEISALREQLESTAGAAVLRGPNGVTSAFGLFCGATERATNGGVREGAARAAAATKRMCENACGSPTAHLCTDHEIARSSQLGLMPLDRAEGTTLWIEGTFGYVPAEDGMTEQFNNCRDWTTALDGLPPGEDPAVGRPRGVALTWRETPRAWVMKRAFCSGTYELACCDATPAAE